MFENSEKKAVKTKRIRKMTKERLQNIALYYLERFDSSSANLYISSSSSFGIPSNVVLNNNILNTFEIDIKIIPKIFSVLS